MNKSNKSRRRKLKIEKKKTKLTQEYIKTEAEVKALIQAQNANRKDAVVNTTDEEIRFFTGVTFGPTTKNIEGSNVIDVEHDREAASERESSIAVASSETPRTQPASSYIQIEDAVNPIEKVKPFKIIFSDDLLFIPSSKESSILPKFEEKQNLELLEKHGLYVTKKVSQVINSNTIRMINRLSQEEHFDWISSPNHLCDQQEIIKWNFFTKSYKTECGKKFLPIPSVSSLYQTENIEFTSVQKYLTICFKKLLFLEHPLQTEEHRLASKLEELYEAYKGKTENNLIEKMTVELRAVRDVIQKMIEEINEDNLQKLEKFIMHAKYLRNALHKEELMMKNLIKSILDTWLSLKTLRKRQEIKLTNIKILVQIEEVDKKTDEVQWEKRYQVELNEILREEYEMYYRMKRNQLHQKRQQENDEYFMSSLSAHKPDIEVIKTNLRETLMKCTRLPGEPKITIIKRYINEETIQNFNKIKDYYFKIYFDDNLLDSSKIFKLKNNFKISLENETFSVYLERKFPKDIKIELHEKSKIHVDIKIANMYLPILKITNYNLSSTEIVEFSSKKFKISGKLKVLIYLSNCPETNLQLESDNVTDEQLAVSTYYQKPKRFVKIDKDTLSKWYDNELLNPLDPDCLSLIKNLDQNIESQETYKNDNNSFIFEEDLIAFCSKDEISNNYRFKMLKSRYKNDVTFKDYRFVPLFDNEIEEISKDKVIEEGNWMDPIDVQKYKGRKYLQKLFDIVRNHCILLQKNEETSNLLIGDELPTISRIIQMMMRFFAPTRSLPMFFAPKQNKISVRSNDNCDFNILINVIRATGIPVRNFITHQDRRRNSSISSVYQALKYSNVHPYVSVTYKDNIMRTTTADGSNPTWNEQLILKISGKPSEFRDEVKFSIFDEYVEDLLNDDTTRGMEVYQRIHMNWLGELRIPLSTIFLKQTIEGVFELNSPKVIVGYIRPTLDSTNGTEAINEDVPEIKESVYLSLYISIEPQYELSDIRTSCLECSELKEVKLFIQEWFGRVREDYPENLINPLISLANGKRVCITRLLEPIPLPFENNTENIERILRRYVSLIPVLNITNSCTQLSGIWLNNQMILDTTWASLKDLGVLLTCFYLNLGINAYLILGIGFYYGECTFVMIKEGSTYNLIDPLTGKIYSRGDVYCPLEKIFYIVTTDNAYFNIQSEIRASMTDFNFNNSSLWIPIFNKNNPSPIGGVHKLNYKFKMSYSVTELRRNIERKIMKKMNSWRSNRKTIWNRAISDVLYNVLRDLENEVILEQSCDNYSKRIIEKIQTHKLFGFALNFAYINLSSIAERIKSTGIHLNTDRNVEFSVAVHINEYRANILSVWTFLVSAIPVFKS